MYILARLYSSVEQADAVAEALIAAGYTTGDVEVVHSQVAAPAAAESDEDAPPPVASAVDTSRARQMLGQHADFYLSELTDGRSLVVATPHWVVSGPAETILDEHDPLPFSHEPPAEAFVPVSQQAAPFSEMLGIPVLTKTGRTVSEGLGFKTSREGLSHFSRWFPPLASDFRFSSLFGMKLESSGATPLSSKLGLPLSSNRGAGKSSSFGMPLLSKSKHYLNG